MTEIAVSDGVGYRHGIPAAGACHARCSTDLLPGEGLEQLERYEGMRVLVPALRAVSPDGRAPSPSTMRTGTSNGVFFGVIDGTARPFREPGIPMLDPLPAGAPSTVPRVRSAIQSGCA